MLFRSCWHRLLFCVMALSLAPIGLGQEGTSEGKPVDPVMLEVPAKLRVATREVPPFAMRNEDDQWEGISIDLFREVKAELESQSGHEIDVEFIDLSFSRSCECPSERHAFP